MNAPRARALRFPPIARAAWIALVGLAIGGAVHGWHHVADPLCESPDLGSTHACAACSALHGGVLAGQSDPALTPPPTGPAHLTLLPAEPRVAHDAPVGPPRGPPAA